MKRIWVTRALPGAEATAQRLRALGADPIVAPVLAVRTLSARIDLTGVAALAFTSANAVRAFAAISEARGLAVFAVGAATAAEARAAGFGEVHCAEGDVAALGRFIAARADRLSGAVLHPGAAQPAGDLTGSLRNAGVEARALAIYETVAADVPDAVLAGLAAIDGVLVHSPRAGWRLAEILADRPAPGLVAYCLSGEVAATVAGLDLASSVTAPLPSEDALLSLVVG